MSAIHERVNPRITDNKGTEKWGANRAAPMRPAFRDLQNEGEMKGRRSTCLASCHAIAAAAIIVLTLGCSSTPYRSSAAASNQRAPEFTAQTLGGQPVPFASLRGKVIILHLWAAWDCAEELPGLEDIASRSSSRDITVVAVSIDKERSSLERIVRLHAASHLRMLHDPSGEVAEKYSPKDFPAAYVIDREGTIRYAHHGLTTRDLPQIEEEARQLGTELPLTEITATSNRIPAEGGR